MSIPNLTYTVARGITYYRYRLPDGKRENLGTDILVAEKLALKLNIIRAEKEAVRQGARVSMRMVIDEFRPMKMRMSISVSTKENWEIKLRQYEMAIGKWLVDEITVRQLDEFCLGLAPTYEPYRTHRLMLGEIFTFAIGKGWREQAKGNPAKALLPPKLAREKKQKLRGRMTAEQYSVIYDAAPEWLQIAMALARLIGIRRSDVCRLRSEDFRAGFLHFIPEKTADLPTPAAIKIPIKGALLELCIRAKALSPVSEYFIHKHNSFARTGESAARIDRTQVLPEQLSRAFKKVLRDVGFIGQDAPTFHEIRSLCAREYRDKGWEIKQVQQLLGHADEGMTAYYQSGAGINWTEVSL